MKTTKHQRAKNLSVQDVAGIVHQIENWTGKFTWPALCLAIASRTRQEYTRQALFKHEAIRTAFDKRKSELSASRSGLESVEEKDQLAEMRAQITRLEAQLDGFRDKFEVWAYNAYAKGMSEADLNRPLPVVDRDRTDDLEALRKRKRERKVKNG